MKRKEMLEILADIVQGSDIYGDAEQELLNFISELEEEETIDSYRDCIIKFITEIEDIDKIKRIYRMSQILWKKE